MNEHVFTEPVYVNGVECGYKRGYSCAWCGSQITTEYQFNWEQLLEGAEDHDDDSIVMHDIPSEVWGFQKTLTHLSLWCSPHSVLDQKIACLTELKVLMLGECSYSEGFHHVEPLSKLEKLEISYCNEIEALPAEFFQLENLKTLILEGHRLEFSPSIEQARSLKNLEVLVIKGNERPPTLPLEICYISSLKVLEIGSLKTLQEVPQDIGSLENLETLKFARCGRLVNLPAAVWQLVNLKCLKICGTATTMPSAISNLTNLESLSIDYPNLESIPDGLLASLPKLTTLDIESCQNPFGIDAIPPKLKSLRLWHCHPDSVRNLVFEEPGLKEVCRSLESLVIIRGTLNENQGVNLPERLPHTLRRLTVYNCEIGWDVFANGNLPQ
jgi:hypothetical protein